ncbi:MAG: LysM peptidoglycan-binding domain-containing protein [candidate division Zixibacteria bacterium]|nr:LysM peptidoglycan-binding domain-containing protein [candidate division Zixibacteria bacterium]
MALVFCLLPSRLALAQTVSNVFRTDVGTGGDVSGRTAIDSLYAEEAGEISGFPYLLQGWPRENFLPDDPLPEIDMARFDLPLMLDAPTRKALWVFRVMDADTFSEWLKRFTRYRPMVLSILTREGLPKDLIGVALAASGFDPRAHSGLGTAGLWQVAGAVADEYGLDRTAYIDERYDPEKSTRAMAQRFRALFRRFGNWELAIAACYAGHEQVEAAMRTKGTPAILLSDLPQDTQRFVYFSFAAAVVLKDPAVLGFETTALPPLTFETVPVVEDRSLQEIANGARISVEHLKKLNPELRAWTAPSGYTLKIPVGMQPQYRAWAGLAPLAPPPANLMAYKVRRGDTITSIARRFGLDPEEVALENNLLVKSKLKKGRVLFVPIYEKPAPLRTSVLPENPPDPVAVAVPAVSADTEEPEAYNREKLTYKVKRGDTLASIGRRYRVSVAELQEWNGLRNPGSILVGQRLTVFKPAASVATEVRKQKSTNPPLSSGSETIVYTVKRGDTLWDIARRFNVTLSAIRATNNLTRRSAIHPGDRLKIIQDNVR